MPADDLTAIAVILDRSGSMTAIADDAEGGLHAFIEQQKSEPGRATMTVVRFDHDYERLHDNVPVEEITKRVRLEPRGNTALLDAMGKTIADLGEKLAFMSVDERPSKVIVVTITDGHENASREWTWETLSTLMRSKREIGWEFLYLSADVNAMGDAGRLGFDRDQVATFAATPAGARGMSSSYGSTVSTYRSTGKAAFTPEDETR